MQGLLGTLAEFKARYERPITAGSSKDVYERQRRMGAEAATKLRKIIAPYFLRREKKDVLPSSDRSDLLSPIWLPTP